MNIDIDKIYLNNNAIDYVADDGIIKAVEIAIALGKPLLISGEPGTGKTKLADFVAMQLATQTQGKDFAFLNVPYVFNTKSTSVSTDLFYFYDAVSHFRSQHADTTTEQFIELKPMGLAIAQTYGLNSNSLQGISKIGNMSANYLQPQPRSSVVLIDEIDKAPREFPNDLLNEMENYSFDIKEINQSVTRCKSDCRILVIMTSNSEKNLPNAFLRRCVFYHIGFPDKDKLLLIAKKRLMIDNTTYDELIGKAIDEFNNIRNRAMNKKPSTSEFLDWINLLQHYKLLNNSSFAPDNTDPLYEATKSTLIKNYEDQLILNNKAGA
ncbi:MAG TPA: MoxR family ATPase [Chitinophagaceae bacterium]|jgi:MoxR-like ATPase|nr:MoxR family ATPase [Chitinophagaceae bacterium]